MKSEMSKIYPDIETLRRASDTYEKMPPAPLPTSRASNLEKNCGQIFAKGPALILDKMQRAEIGPNTTYLLGYELKTRQFWVLAGLMLLFLLSSSGMIVMWFTNMFDNAIFSHLVISDEGSLYEMWKKPSPKPLMKVFIFNYTNVHDFEMGDAEKLNVQELGPYIYEESLERVAIKFNGTTVSFKEQKSYKFLPDLSKGRKQNDRVIVPNIPLFGAAAVNKYSNFLTRIGLSGLLNGLNAKPFLSLAAHRFIIGYEDNLYSLSRSVLKLQNQNPPSDHFGLVSSKIGEQTDVITLNTGAKDINKVSRIQLFNGQSEMNHWSTAECNSFSDATDGTMYPPKSIRNKRPVHVFIKDMCRTLPFDYSKEVKILNGKIPAYRYVIPKNIFDSPDKTPSNQCYCNMDLGECPPQGVFNASSCAFGAPAFISFPHFYNGDESLRQGITGLNPNPTVYESYFDLHPTLGFVMAGKTRFQMNVQVVKSFGISQLNMFEDGLMLPIAWIEMSLEDKTLPEDVVGIIFQTTFTVKTVELGLKYGTLLMTLTTFVGILIVMKNKLEKRERTSSMRPLQRRNGLE